MKFKSLITIFVLLLIVKLTEGCCNSPVPPKPIESSPEMTVGNPPSTIIEIIQRHFANKDERAIVERSSFSEAEVAALDEFLRQSSGKRNTQFVKASACGTCTIPGGSKGYKIFALGFWQCWTCGS